MRKQQAKVARVARGIVARMRGELELERLVEQGLELGRGAYVAKPIRIDPGFPWLVSIGDDARLGPAVEVIVHDASMKRALGYSRLRPVSIGAGAYIGARAVLLPGTTVGEGAVVGAGSVVRGDVAPHTVVSGNPAEMRGSVADHLERHGGWMAAATLLPADGWTISGGITDDRKEEMKAMLARGSVYIE